MSGTCPRDKPPDELRTASIGLKERQLMTKKTMLLAVAVTAMFALPSTVSAQEVHISGITTFTASGGAGTFSIAGEPAFTCTKTQSSGSFDSGSTTTGSVTVDATGCTAEFFGIKANCNTAGAASGTIAGSGTFHLVTVNNKPGMLGTPVPITMICAGFSTITVSGSLIGTITSPACGASSKAFTVAFTASGSTQQHLEYTGVKYDLSAKTGSGSNVTAGLTSSGTMESATQGTLECT
jgi:hypothetical protein